MCNEEQEQEREDVTLELLIMLYRQANVELPDEEVIKGFLRGFRGGPKDSGKIGTFLEQHCYPEMSAFRNFQVIHFMGWQFIRARLLQGEIVETLKEWEKASNYVKETPA